LERARRHFSRIVNFAPAGRRIVSAAETPSAAWSAAWSAKWRLPYQR